MRLSQSIGRPKWAKTKNKIIPNMLPNVPGAMGINPMPKPVAKNKDGLEKTSSNLIFILVHQLLILLYLVDY